MDLRIVKGYWRPIVADDLYYARGLQNRKPVLRIESTEQIARKQRAFLYFDSIRPAFFAFIRRQERCVTFPLQEIRDYRLVPRTHLQRKPWGLSDSWTLQVTVHRSDFVPITTRHSLSFRPSYRHHRPLFGFLR